MEWKGWAMVIGAGMLALAIVGLVTHVDSRIVGADVLGAFCAIAVLMLASRGRRGTMATPLLAAVAFLVMAFLAITSHRAPWLRALTLSGAFAFAFMSLAALSSRQPGGTGGHPRPT
jgi:hypothetical protein